MIRFSAFADEISPDITEQIHGLKKAGIDAIELRLIDGKNIVYLDKAKISEIKRLVDGHGLAVSAIGSPIGKIKINEPFDAHLDLFKKAVDLAVLFNTERVRIFSYYPPEGKSISDYQQDVLERMHKKIEVIKLYPVVMVHENESEIFGHSASNCKFLAETLNSPKFQLAYDSANFVTDDRIMDNIRSCWPLMKPYVSHIHIKDWKSGADIGSIPGQGDGQIKELFEELSKMNYDGYATMEPHLKKGGQFGGTTGLELFIKAFHAAKNLALSAGCNVKEVK